VGEESESHILLKCPEIQEMERGDYDQQVTTYQLGNSTQEDTDCQKYY